MALSEIALKPFTLSSEKMAHVGFYCLPLSVTCASVGGLWDTVSGMYFPGQRQPVRLRRHLPRRTERGTEADGAAAARAGSGEISAENNSAENNSVENVSVLLAVVVTAIVSLLLG